MSALEELYVYPSDEFTDLKDRWISCADQMHILKDYAFYESSKIAIACKHLINCNTETLLIS